MWVCKNCHEADRDVIGCNKSNRLHSNQAYGECDICNRCDNGFSCSKYEDYKKIVEAAEFCSN